MTLGDRKVPYRIPYELVRSEMAGLQGAKGQYLVDGVVVSTFLPMRAIPFKVIFIVGLGRKAVPRRRPREPSRPSPRQPACRRRPPPRAR